MGVRSEKEQVIHDWLIEQVVEFLKKRYRDVRINPGNSKNGGIEGLYPGIVVYSHGLPVEVYEVETENTVTDEEAEQWVQFSKLPVKVNILVPEALVKKAREIIWNRKIASKVRLSSYQISIKG